MVAHKDGVVGMFVDVALLDKYDNWHICSQLILACHAKTHIPWQSFLSYQYPGVKHAVALEYYDAVDRV